MGVTTPSSGWSLDETQQRKVAILVGAHTLSPIIMEVETGGLENDFSLQGGHFPLP